MLKQKQKANSDNYCTKMNAITAKKLFQLLWHNNSKQQMAGQSNLKITILNTHPQKKKKKRWKMKYQVNG